MRSVLLLTLLTVVLLAAGVVVVPAQALATEATERTPSPPATANESTHNTTRPTPTLLSRSELLAVIGKENVSVVTSSRHFVAANGTWFRATQNGTVGAPTPYGNVVPNVDTQVANGTSVNATVEVSREDRPIYVWKVTQPCETTVYNASSGDTVTSLHIPSCSELASPPATPPRTPTTLATPTTKPRTDTTTGTGVGFGIVSAVLALCAVAIRSRRHQ